MQPVKRVFDLLVVEDNPADAHLLKLAFAECAVPTRINVLEDSRDAINYLYGVGKYANVASPDLILLDFHMPTDGGMALAQIKGDPDLLTPVIVFTGSDDPRQVAEIYRRHANCCFRKPSSLKGLFDVVCEIASHWLNQATLPPRKHSRGNGNIPASTKER
jgi:CheY-like chemotaxis protein